jgi:transposase-like protein
MKSLADLPTNKQCHKIVFKMVYGSANCPWCSSKLKFRDRYAWCKVCRFKHRAKSKTFLANSNLSWSQILTLVFCWQKKTPPGEIVKILGISYPTINRWYSRFRLYLPRDKDLENMLEGIGEIDESFFGRLKYGNQQIVIGAIERGSQRLKLRRIPNRRQDTMEEFVTNNVKPGTLILTDSHRSYQDLPFYGYSHDYCNHSAGFFGPTNQIEGFWGVMKNSLFKMYGKLSFRDLDSILKEYEARHNYKYLFTNPFTYFQECLVLH